jgi:hypothetical protein
MSLGDLRDRRCGFAKKRKSECAGGKGEKGGGCEYDTFHHFILV